MDYIKYLSRSIRLAIGIVLLAGYALVFYGSPKANAEQIKDKNISFKWAFGAMVGSESGPRLVSITRSATLKSGDKLKILLKPQKNCYVYLIYHSTDDELFRLFPYQFNRTAEDFKPSEKYYIPQGRQWFELDEKVGQEMFYLLASAERLDHLEALLSRYEAAEVPKRGEAVREILSEIRNIRKRNKKFTATAERPITIGGSMRGISREKQTGFPEIDALAVEVSATNFYYRTYTIDHQ